MPWFRVILWIGSVSLAILLYQKSDNFRKADLPTISEFEFARRDAAAIIHFSWRENSLLNTVREITIYDFIFILFYVLLIMNCSSKRMNLERNLILNNLLRFNIALAVVTGLLDVAENVILIRNLDFTDHISSTWVTILKFVFAGWIIFVWAVAVIKHRISFIHKESPNRVTVGATLADRN
ncbi:MAG TPA: hypothetical protein VIU12_13830 [Chryseolinea sp.]